MIKIPGDTIIQKILIILICIAYAFTVSFIGFIACSQFEDVRILKSGEILQGTIVTVRKGKNMASGAIAYQLPNGVDCLDWTELGPNSEIRQGERLIVAVIGPCGHPISSKKQLHPWVYLCMFLGGILYPPFLMWRGFRRKVSLPTSA